MTQRSAEEVGGYQGEVHRWLVETFGVAVALDKVERNRRFAEETCELLQACGWSRDAMHQTVDWVFSQPSNDTPRIEIGDVSNTLAALATAHGIDMNEAREETMTRCWANIEKTRAKWRTKPRFDAITPPAEDEQP